MAVACLHDHVAATSGFGEFTPDNQCAGITADRNRQPFSQAFDTGDAGRANGFRQIRRHVRRYLEIGGFRRCSRTKDHPCIRGRNRRRQLRTAVEQAGGKDETVIVEARACHVGRENIHRQAELAETLVNFQMKPEIVEILALRLRRPGPAGFIVEHQRHIAR